MRKFSWMRSFGIYTSLLTVALLCAEQHQCVAQAAFAATAADANWRLSSSLSPSLFLSPSSKRPNINSANHFNSNLNLCVQQQNEDIDKDNNTNNNNLFDQVDDSREQISDETTESSEFQRNIANINWNLDRSLSDNSNSFNDIDSNEAEADIIFESRGAKDLNFIAYNGTKNNNENILEDGGYNLQLINQNKYKRIPSNNKNKNNKNDQNKNKNSNHYSQQNGDADIADDGSITTTVASAGNTVNGQGKWPLSILKNSGTKVENKSRLSDRIYDIIDEFAIDEMYDNDGEDNNDDNADDEHHINNEFEQFQRTRNAEKHRFLQQQQQTQIETTTLANIYGQQNKSIDEAELATNTVSCWDQIKNSQNPHQHRYNRQPSGNHNTVAIEADDSSNDNRTTALSYVETVGDIDEQPANLNEATVDDFSIAESNKNQGNHDDDYADVYVEDAAAEDERQDREKVSIVENVNGFKKQNNYQIKDESKPVIEKENVSKELAMYPYHRTNQKHGIEIRKVLLPRKNKRHNVATHTNVLLESTYNYNDNDDNIKANDDDSSTQLSCNNGCHLRQEQRRYRKQHRDVYEHIQPSAYQSQQKNIHSNKNNIKARGGMMSNGIADRDDDHDGDGNDDHDIDKSEHVANANTGTVEYNNFGSEWYLKNNATTLSRIKDDYNAVDDVPPYLNGNQEVEINMPSPTAFQMEKIIKHNCLHSRCKTHKKQYKNYLHYELINTPSTALPTPSSSIPVLADLAPTINTTNNFQPIGNKKQYEFKTPMQNIDQLFPSSPKLAAKPLKSSQSLRPANHQPFYEGQINYFQQTANSADDNKALPDNRIDKHRYKHLSHEWPGRVPILRNALKIKPAERSNHPADFHMPHMPSHIYRKQQQRTQYYLLPKPMTHSNRHRYHPNHYTNHHKASIPSKAYIHQQKLISQSAVTQTMQNNQNVLPWENTNVNDLGHHNTNIKNLEHYYTERPHLARTQFQLNDERYHESHSQLRDVVPEQDTQQLRRQTSNDYKEKSYTNDNNLPPYVKKYNRRNKQLLNLLEGTLEPSNAPNGRWSSSKLQPGPHEGNFAATFTVGLDDKYLKEKRKRHHNQQGKDLWQSYQDNLKQKLQQQEAKPRNNLFAEQHLNGNLKSMHQVQMSNISAVENQFPDENINFSSETQMEHDSIELGELLNENSHDFGDNSKANNLLGVNHTNTQNNGHWDGSPANPANSEFISPRKILKAAYFKLPSYPSIAGSHLSKGRSRSNQFAPSSGSRLRQTQPLFTTHNNSSNYRYDSYNFNKNNNNYVKPSVNAIDGEAKVRYRTNSNNWKSIIDLMKASRKPFSTFIRKSASSTLPPQHNATDTATPDSKRNSNNKNNNEFSHRNGISANGNHTTRDGIQRNTLGLVNNSFVYHRIVDPSPSLVGAGAIGRKQHLPFVAITDRRLEVSTKKSINEDQLSFAHKMLP